MTTWGDLRAGDVILDKNDVPWTVEVLALITGSDPELWRVSIRHEDLPTTIGLALLASAFVVVANIVVDVLYVVLDPRVRLT